MTFKEERDRAAEEHAIWKIDGQEIFSAKRYDAFKAGADWALKSEVVRGLVNSLQRIAIDHNIVAKDALEACAQAVKERK